MALIEIQHLTKTFYPARTFGAWIAAPLQRGRPITALDDVSVTVEQGELVCLMGSNGAGKTTLLKTLAGLILPTSGTIILDGHMIQRHMSVRLRSQIGFASSERPGFYDRLTGRQNLEFFAVFYGMSDDHAGRRIDELLSLLEITTPDQRYQEYSTGMKQRLLLARVLLHEPPILLLDEPTRSLDPLQATKLRELIRNRLHREMGKTIVLSTHQVEEAEQLVGRIAVLHRGSIRGCGTLEQLAGERPLREAIQRLCG